MTPGTKVGGCEILALIGGMGEVDRWRLSR
jgi:hypothetical protein